MFGPSITHNFIRFFHTAPEAHFIFETPTMNLVKIFLQNELFLPGKLLAYTIKYHLQIEHSEMRSLTKLIEQMWT